MQKLTIFLAATAVAFLGMAGTAAADGHEAACDPIPTTEDADKEGEEMGSPSEDSGPVGPVVGGLRDTCLSNSEDGPSPGVLCGVADGVIRVTDQASEDIGAGITGSDQYDEFCVAGDDDDDDGDDDDDDSNGGNENDGVAAAQQQSAGADGTLPRTGGFSVAGFGLVSIGALVRRLIA